MLLFSIYWRKTFYPAQYIFINLVSLFMNIFFINSIFCMFNENSVTNILNDDFYITFIFNRNNRLLFCNYQVTGECINIFHQGKRKSNMSKISITLDNNAFFLVKVLVIFRVFIRKQRDHLKLFDYFSNCDTSLKI